MKRMLKRKKIFCVSYFTADTGFNKFNINTFRLWKTFKSQEFIFGEYNKVDFPYPLAERDQAS